jgi:prephenate dehydrogenase
VPGGETAPGVRLSILGVGLIGGSVGLAARERVADAHVLGFDVSERALSTALERGAIDEACPEPADAVRDTDVCFVCCPVGVVGEVAIAALRAGGDCAVTDVGSAKGAVLAGVHAAGLPERDASRFIGGHPLAGAEAAGVEHARPDLFAGATWYLTPGERSSGVHYDRLFRTISSLGARPVAIGADTHDRLMATVSHLPHVLANVLVAQAARALLEEEQHLPSTGPSFRDATRVAGTNPAVWRDIFLSNREAIEAELEAYRDALDEVHSHLEAGDAAALERWIEAARSDRQRLLELELAGGPVSELRVSVPNKPGIVAQVALALGEAGVNIVDMALYPAVDMQSGAIALWVSGDDGASRAVELIARLGYPAAVVDNGGE